MKRKIIIASAAHRQRAASEVLALPTDSTAEVVISPRKERRSDAQNRRMWAMLDDISKQVIWHGQRLSREEWKDVFTAALKRQKAVPGIDGGFVVIGAHTSRMSMADMAEMIEFMFAFGAERGVVWSDPTLPVE